MNASPTLKGILLMLLGVSLLSIMDSAVKWLLLKDISVIEIIAVRGWLITLVLLLSLPKQGGWKTLQTGRIKLHLLRTVIGFFAPLCFFLSLKYLPLADTTAIFFCTTFFMTAGSTIILGEYVGLHRWLAVFIGFIGVVLVSSPGTESFHPASILPLIAGAAYAVIILTGRLLARTDKPIKLVFYFNAFNTLIASCILPFFWATPSMEIMLMLLLVSALALAGYFCLTNAFTLAPVSAIAPIEYVALIWATLLGYLLWHEIPSLQAWQGMALILAAGLYIMWRESRHRPAMTMS
jgi:drug/metabolite transporter (DMT)-like permease